MRKKILLVPEVHHVNWLFYLLLSFFYEIKAHTITAAFIKRWPGRISQLEVQQYLSWEECFIDDSAVARIADDILKGLRSRDWLIMIKQYALDFSAKARQDLRIEIQKAYFFSRLSRFFEGRGRKVLVAESLAFSFLSNASDHPEVFAYRRLRLVSFVNVVLDRIYMYLIDCYLAGSLLSRLLAGLRRRPLLDLSRVVCLWDGISPRELSIDFDRNTFAWIVDGHLIKKEDVLFLLPQADFQMKDFSLEAARAAGFMVMDKVELPTAAPPSRLAAAVRETVRLILARLVWARLSFTGLRLTDYGLRALRWLPVVEETGAAIYVNSISDIGHEAPALALFKSAGIKTVMWTYGTNSYFFTTDNDDCDFRHVLFSDLLSDKFLTWNDHYKEFIESHTQNNVEALTIGPMMCGDEGVMSLSREAARAKYGLRTIADRPLTYIAVFDVPPPSPGFSGAYCVGDPNSSDYCLAFMRDIVRLLHEISDLFIVYKPKRSLTSGKFVYADGFDEILAQLTGHERASILDYNVNPWVPIAVADMTVSMPFESPFIASIHYGRPAIFHDPLNVAEHHRYGRISDSVTHDYRQLKARLEALMRGNVAFLPNEMREFMGAHPGTNSSDRVRKHLIELAHSRKMNELDGERLFTDQYASAKAGPDLAQLQRRGKTQ